ncbi:MAG: DMT family transporter [Candidatus Zixiibacteriota bacterium]
MNTFLVATLCFVWGATWVAIKIGLEGAPPFYSAAFRFMTAAVVLAAMTAFGRKPLLRDRRVLGWTLLSGVFMYFGSYAVVYYAEQFIAAGLAAIIFATFPFFVAIGAHFHLQGERLNWLKMVGLIVGFSGVVVIFGGGLSVPDPDVWWAMGLMLLSPLFSAVASIIVKRHLTHENPVSLNFLQMLVGVAVLMPFAMINEDIGHVAWNATTVGTVLFLGIFGSAYTFVVYFHLLKTVEASRLALIAFATPVVASLLGWLVLDERLRWTSIVGAILVFVGIWIVNILAVRRAVRSAPQPEAVSK